jgi:hypothetical protein
MSLFQRGIRPPATWSDEALERYLAAIRDEVLLDPMFRRRLRGTVVNRFVAEREGDVVATRARGARRMGALGRSVLYASVALAASVSGTMAASQGSVPGDALYPLKRQIESLRLEALPAQFHDDLAAHALGERIEEIGRLAERGDWEGVAAHAAAVDHDSDAFLELTDLDSASADRYLVVLSGLIDRLPVRAQLAIEDAVSHLESAAATAGAGGRPTTAGGGSSNGQGGGSSNGQGGGSSNGQGSSGQGGQNGGGSSSASSEPSASEPTPPPTVEPTPRPTPRSEPRATAQPDPTPKPQPTPQSSKKAKPSPPSSPSGNSSD